MFDTITRRSARLLLVAAAAATLPAFLLGVPANAASLAPGYAFAAPLNANGDPLNATVQATAPGQDAWAYISADPQFSTIVGMVTSAGLQSAFSGGTSTFLVPTNSAFNVLDSTKVSTLAGDNAAIGRLVNSIVSNSNPSLLDFALGLDGAVAPAVNTITTCTNNVVYDVNGNLVPDPNNTCSTLTTTETLAAPVTALAMRDGSVRNVTVTGVSGDKSNGVQVLVDQAAISTSATVTNGTVDAIDTVPGL